MSNEMSENSFKEKKVKKEEFVATTLYGLEEILAEELDNLGAGNISLGSRAVYFEGDRAVLYKANLYCRTAIKILKPIVEFECPDEEALYEEIGLTNWEKYMTVDDTFAIDGVTFSSTINHSKYVALKTKDAICEIGRAHV